MSHEDRGGVITLLGGLDKSLQYRPDKIVNKELHTDRTILLEIRDVLRLVLCGLLTSRVSDIVEPGAIIGTTRVVRVVDR